MTDEAPTSSTFKALAPMKISGGVEASTSSTFKASPPVKISGGVEAPASSQPMKISGDVAFSESWSLSADGTFKANGIDMNKQGIKGSVRPAQYEITSDALYYPKDEILGKGSCAVVKKAIHKQTLTLLAVKVFDVFDERKRSLSLKFFVSQ